MKFKLSFLLLTILPFICFNKTNAQCCAVPHNLKIKSFTDTFFCVEWLARDTAQCISSGFEVQYRQISQAQWTSKLRPSHGDSLYFYCDTASNCKRYQWRVRSICHKNTGIQYAAWQNGPIFSLPCNSINSKPNVGSETSSSYLSVTSDASHNRILINGNFWGNIKLSISRSDGKIVFNKTIAAGNKHLQTSIDISSFAKGVYFISAESGLKKLRKTFIKS
jgi:hypothetical protein